ncbi:MAG: UDP-N-acetylmuramate dehydrogenase [Bryobacterales bacterium]|nr:UDP-N-acetylmuramate dehydrogenase [Bryobacterales bacterium]
MTLTNHVPDGLWETGTLASIEGLQIRPRAVLSQYTRFGIGGLCTALVDVLTEEGLRQALRELRAAGQRHIVIGQGSNLIVSGEGFPGIVLRYTASSISLRDGRIVVDAGAVLQTLVDFSIDQALEGLHTMTGIPGWVGAAVYGNAGAYGHSIHEFVREVRFFDGVDIRSIDNAACEFAYRESVFKRRKEWIILCAVLELPRGDRAALYEKAQGILKIRNEKYPPTMKCAGSIFKNLLLRDLAPEVQARIPASVIREGKVPSAWFLEQIGAKGMRRGDIQVAAYHANLIYNDGAGKSADLVALIRELKARVWDMFGLRLEEEVQYVGFPE